MKKLDRREFLGGSILAAGSLALGIPHLAKGATATDVNSVINPNNYGHSIGHLNHFV